MFICENCDAHFHTPNERKECIMGEYYETYGVCPFCGSEDFDEARSCEHCGEFFPENDLTEGLCEECLEALSNDPKFLRDYVLYNDEGWDDFADWYVRTFKRGA